MIESTLRAQWVVPSCRSPIRDGVITVSGNRISRVEAYTTKKHAASKSQMVDLGDVAVIPGLVNAHTHLEFSHLSEPLGFAGIEFTRWIELVIAERLGRTEAALTAIPNGIRESIEAGTIAVGEVATSPWLLESNGIDERLLGRFFIERLGNDPRREDAIVAGTEYLLNELNRNSAQIPQTWRFGISPHAPYSVGLSLLRQLIGQSINFDVPLAMHLAETPLEIDLLCSQSGPFVTLLKKLGAWFPGDAMSCTTIADYLNLLQSSRSCLLIHGNYLTDQEMDFISRQPQFTVVYCPRTHRFFQHSEYPLKQLLQRRINVGVGTDSRASNPDLSLWRELQCMNETFPWLEPQTILGMGTWNGAIALDLQQDVGDVKPGLLARFLRIPISSNIRNPYDELFGQCARHLEWVEIKSSSGN